MSADYLIVNNNAKEYFDPSVLTGCVGFGNFAAFECVGKAIMLLTHTNNSPSYESHEPMPHVSDYIGRWVNNRVFTAGKNHKGKEFTGNQKIGNLYRVAFECFEDITHHVVDMLKCYGEYERGHLPPPAPAPEPDAGKPEGTPAEVEIVDNIRFITKYDGAKRFTVIQEKRNGEWHTVHATADDEEGGDE